MKRKKLISLLLVLVMLAGLLPTVAFADEEAEAEPSWTEPAPAESAEAEPDPAEDAPLSWEEPEAPAAEAYDEDGPAAEETAETAEEEYPAEAESRPVYDAAHDAIYAAAEEQTQEVLEDDPAAASAVVTLEGWTYGEEPNAPSVAGWDGEAAYTYAARGSAAFSDEVPTEAGTYIVRASQAGAVLGTAEFTIAPKHIAGLTIYRGNSPVYSGAENTLDVTILDVTIVYGELTLVRGTDYVVENYDSVQAGSAAAYIEGRGNYTGHTVLAFSVLPKSLGDESIAVSLGESALYTGAAILPPDLVVTDSGAALEPDRDYTYEVSNNVYPGTARVVLYGMGNYTGSVEKTFTIRKTYLTLRLTQAGWVCGAPAAAPVLTGNLGGGAVTYAYAPKGSDAWTEEVPSEVGEYTVRAAVAETEYYEAGEVTADFAITPAAITPVVTITDWTYGDTANAPTVTESPGNGRVTYAYAAKGSSAWTETVPTEAGEYTVKAAVAASGNYGGGSATADFTIWKADIAPSVSLSGWTYGGEAAAPVVTGNPGSGAVTYAYAARGGEDYFASVPTGAGDYTIKAIIGESANYNGASATADFTISKAEAGLSVTTTGTPEFGASDFALSASAKTDGALRYTSGDPDVAAIDPATGAVTVFKAGTASFTVSSAETENYKAGEAAVTVTFTAKNNTVTVAAASYDKKYGDEPFSLGALQEYAGGSPVSYEVTSGAEVASVDADGEVTIHKAGTAVITVASAGAEGQWIADTKTVTVNVAKRSVTITPDDQWAVYGGVDDIVNSCTVTGDGLKAGDTFAVSCSYVNNRGRAVTPRNAGVYGVVAEVTGLDPENYDITVGRGTLTVAPRSVNVTANHVNKTYGEADPELTAVVSGLLDGDELHYTLTRAAGENAGQYIITIVVTGDANYTITPVNGTFTILKKAVTVTARNASRTYGEANPAFAYDVSPALAGEDTLTVTYACEAGESSNVGVYEIVPVVAPSANYEVTTVSGTLSVAAKELTDEAIAVAPESFTYDGTAKEPAVTVKDGRKTVPASEYEVSYSGNINAGTGTVTVTDNEGGNYNVHGSKTFTIGKASIAPVISIDGWTYGDAANAPVVSGTLGDGEQTITYAVKGGDKYNANVPENAGRYTVKVTVAETANYLGGSATADFTIAKKPIAPVVSIEGWMYGEAAKTPVVSGNTGNGEVSCQYVSADNSGYSGSEAPSDAGRYTLHATIAETANYAGGTAVTGFVIQKAGSDLSVTGSIEKSYGDDAFVLETRLARNSGAALSFVSSDPTVVSVDGQGTVTIRGAGTATITVTAAATKNFAEGEQTVTITVAKIAGVLTVTEVTTGITLSYGDTYTIVPTEVVGDEGNTPRYTIKDGAAADVVSVNSAAGTMTAVKVGSTSIEITLPESANYTEVKREVRVTVVPAALIITPDDGQGKLYGEADPEMTYTATGLVEGDAVTVTLTRAEGEAVGTYAIYTEVNADSNYDISAKNGVFTIHSKTLGSAAVSIAPESFIYDGTAKEPAVTVMDGDREVPAEEYTVSYSDNVNAGTGTVTVTDVDGGSYILTETTKTFVIEKASVTVAADDKRKTYGEADPVLTGTVTGLVEGETLSVTYARETGEEVGEYSITPSVREDDTTKNYSVTLKTGTLTITSKEITPTVLVDADGLRYDGQAKEPAVTVTDGDTALTAGKDYTVSCRDNVNAGEAVVTVKAAEGGNYSFADVTETFKIGKALFDAYVVLEGWTYGAYDPAVNAPAIRDYLGTAQPTYIYLDAAGNEVADIAAADAGSYRVKAVLGRSDNAFGGVTTQKFTIAKAESGLSVSAERDDLTYGDTKIKLTVDKAAGNDGAVTFASSSEKVMTVDGDGNVTVVGAGTTTITAASAETANFKAGFASVTFTVKKAKGELTIAKTAYDNLTYGDASFSIGEITSIPADGVKSYASSNPGVAAVDDSGSVTIVGAGTATITVKLSESENYSEAEEYVSVTVSPKPVTVTARDASKTYGEADPALTARTTGLVGADALTITLEREAGEDVGDYVITASETEGANPNYAITFVPGTLTITPAAIAPVISIEGWTYGETPHAPVVTGDCGDGAVTFTYVRKDGAAVEDIAIAGAGEYTVTATIAAAGNYAGGAASADFTIAKADIAPVVSMVGWVYGSEIINSPGVSGNLGGGAVTYTYRTKNGEAVEDIGLANAGEYTVTATVEETSDYHGGEVSADFVITKAEAGLCVVAVDDKTYGDSDFRIEAAAAYSDPDVRYTSTNKAVAVVDTDGVVTLRSAGTATITVSVAETVNYYGGSAAVTFTVRQRHGVLTVVEQEYDKTYGDPDFRITNVVSEGETNVLFESSDPGVAAVECDGTVHIISAGTAEITLSMLNGVNYTPAAATVTVNVAKKAATVTAMDKTITYGDDEPELTAMVSGVVDDDRVTYALSRTEGTDAGAYAITVTTEEGENPNYEIIAAPGTLTIAPKAVSVAAEAKTKTYGDEDPELTASVTGLVGEDALEITLERKAGEDAGTYVITPTVQKNPNYDITTETSELTIKTRDIAGAEVTLGKVLRATGSEQTQQIVSVTLAGEPVTYEVTGNTATEAGTYTLTVTGTGNYSGSVKETFVVAPGAEGDMALDIGLIVQTNGSVPAAWITDSPARIVSLLTQNGTLSAEELSALADGGSLDITLSVSDADGAISAPEGYTIGQVVDITLFVQLTQDGQTLPVKQITELPESITIGIQLPQELLNDDSAISRTFAILHGHGGSMDILPTSLDEASSTLSFETSSFSPFAIAYKDAVASSNSGKAAQNTGATSPKTDDAMTPGLYIVLIVMCILGLAGIPFNGQKNVLGIPLCKTVSVDREGDSHHSSETTGANRAAFEWHWDRP